MIHLTVRNLYKRYGLRSVLENINIDQSAGILGIGGRNGSGKSTLLKCLSGLTRPTSGKVEWHVHQQKLSPSDIKQHLGFLAPHVNLYEELTCLENLRFIADLRSQTADSAKPSILLEQVGLKQHRDQPFGSLSTGQQQRLKLAAARIHDPPILFLDEPGANLDENGTELVRRLVQEYREDQRMVLLASNTPAELEWCDRCYYVDRDDNES